MKCKFIAACALAIVMVFAAQTPAHATGPTQVWIASSGTDSGTCGAETSPCKTFGQAITNAGTGGEVDCLTPGTYASQSTMGAPALTIAASITINCPGGRVVVQGEPAFGIAVTGGTVTLIGLSIEGIGVSTAGIAVGGANVILDSVEVNGFGGDGLLIDNSTAVTVAVSNSQFTNNNDGIVVGGSAAATVSLNAVSVGNNGSGIVVAPTADTVVNIVNSVVSNSSVIGINIESDASHSISVAINRTHVAGSVTDGVLSESDGGFINLSVEESVISGNTQIGILTQGSQALTTIDRSLITSNQIGVQSDTGANFATGVLLGNSTITSNSQGLAVASGGKIFSYGNNSVNGNGTTFPGNDNVGVLIRINQN
jgi:hypothetical protein